MPPKVTVREYVAESSMYYLDVECGKCGNMLVTNYFEVSLIAGTPVLRMTCNECDSGPSLYLGYKKK